MAGRIGRKSDEEVISGGVPRRGGFTWILRGSLEGKIPLRIVLT